MPWFCHMVASSLMQITPTSYHWLRLLLSYSNVDPIRGPILTPQNTVYPTANVAVAQSRQTQHGHLACTYLCR
jgi:hypothetical protein